MLHISDLRNNKEQIISSLKIKNFDAENLVNSAIAKDDERKAIQQKSDDLLSQQNKIAKEIGVLFKTGKVEKANDLKQQSIKIKKESQETISLQNKIEEELLSIIVQIPNVPHKSVVKGNSDQDNEILNEFGDKPNLIKDALPHWELAEKYNLIDFKLGNKITGSGFPVFKGKGAKLQRALISFFLDENINAGYEEYLPPSVVNTDSMFGTGALPDKEGQMYHITSDDLYLIPTAEVPVTNFYRNTIVKDFPIKCTAYTPCFRREAGSYGKDVRGLNRLHQFDKVEIVQIEHPKNSYETLEKMVDHVSEILKKLELPFRIVRLCGGDLSFTSSLTYDFEVYSAAQDRWLEVSSVSNFESFQSNRLKLRFKDENGKSQLCHTLNGSAIALPRIYAALLENNQFDGGIKIPEILHTYTTFDSIT
jgi:seryl-tRNA synthetase|tara:strand:+ start:302 stop:1567 length:1266 start_codon:yes stop_codon:yes gene_type:complete